MIILSENRKAKKKAYVIMLMDNVTCVFVIHI